MIIRIWRGATKNDDADAYVAYMERTGLSEYRATEGNLGASLLRREEEGRTRFVFISLWASFEAIRRFAGEDVDRAVFYPEDDRFLIDRDLEVDHLEVALSSFDTVNVRYMVDDVDSAVAFYTTHLGFTLGTNAAPAFADVTRGSLRLLLSGRSSSAGRPMPDGRSPGSGGWNRIEFVVEDIAAEVERLRRAGVHFRNDVVVGPGGKQILLDDPSGNPVELFQPAGT